MRDFHLKIVTPAGQVYDAMAARLTLRTRYGDVTILPGHINYVAPLGMGRAEVATAHGLRLGACIGGIVSVIAGEVVLVATSFEWAEDIDVDRAKASEIRAKALLEDGEAGELDRKLAKARLKRAQIRQGVAEEAK